jgi:hypothetical protein
MMARRRGPTRAQRSSAIRAKWAAHVGGWQRSGSRQIDYCREHGLNAKYFGLWKSRLARAGTVASPATEATPPTLVPVVVRPDRAPAAAKGRTDKVPPQALGLRVMLPNGVELSFQLQSARAVSPLLTEFARLSC